MSELDELADAVKAKNEELMAFDAELRPVWAREAQIKARLRQTYRTAEIEVEDGEARTLILGFRGDVVSEPSLVWLGREPDAAKPYLERASRGYQTITRVVRQVDHGTRHLRRELFAELLNLSICFGYVKQQRGRAKAEMDAAMRAIERIRMLRERPQRYGHTRQLSLI